MLMGCDSAQIRPAGEKPAEIPGDRQEGKYEENRSL